MIDSRKIGRPVVNMFRVNMGLKTREKVVVITDTPTLDEWKNRNSEELADGVRRSVLAKTVSEIASKTFRDCEVEFFSYPSVGKDGTNPGEEVAKVMTRADIVIAITTYSLSHTDARERATQAGTRIASMPRFVPEMFYPGGPMGTDYRKIAHETKRFADIITESKNVNIRSRAGTDLSFSVEGREGRQDAGFFVEKGSFGNLPSGEAYCAPVEGTTNGQIVVQKGWYPDLKQNMTLIFREGKVIEIAGGGQVGDRFRELVSLSREAEPYVSRRNHAELGIGTNPNARRPDNVLEAEKIRGTVHVAIGDSSHIGGLVKTDLHEDFVIARPTLRMDNRVVIRNGNMLL